MKGQLAQSLRRWIPRGHPLWYVYFYGKSGLRKLRNPARYREELRHVIHNNIRLDEYRTIYFYIPKVACSSLKSVCAKLLKLEVPQGEGKDLLEEVHRVPFPYARKYRVLRDFGDYFRFCVVRNPWDRLVSCYKDKINYHQDHVYAQYENSFITYLKNRGLFKPEMQFDEFVDAICAIDDDDAEGHFRSQHTYISDERGNNLVNYVGKMENMPEAINRISEGMGVAIDMPHLRRTQRDSYKKYYSPRSQQRVAERYQHDIELFGYDFDGHE